MHGRDQCSREASKKMPRYDQLEPQRGAISLKGGNAPKPENLFTTPPGEEQPACQESTRCKHWPATGASFRFTYRRYADGYGIAEEARPVGSRRDTIGS